jgi:hypothetical protein
VSEIRIWVALAVLAAAGPVRADDADPDDEASPADEPPAAVAASPTVVTPAGKAASSVEVPPLDAAVVPPPLKGFAWQPFGYLRMQYITVQNDPQVEFIGRNDGFELQNARIGIRGTLDDRAAFTLSFDGAVDERVPNAPQGRLRPALRDAHADVLLPGRMFVRGGFFQTWLDPESLIANTARAFVDQPIESRGMRNTQGWFTPGLPPGRSLGVSLRMNPITPTAEEPVQLGFELAVQNGADEFASNNDNDQPALSVAALVRFGAESWIVAAARYNPRTVGELPFRQDETDLQASIGGQLTAGPIQLGAAGIVQRTTFPSTAGPVENAFGAHAQALFALPAALPLAIGYRFGILDPSSLIVSDRVMEHTVGGVLGVPSLRMRVQLQLTHVQEQAARELANSRAQLAVELAL